MAVIRKRASEANEHLMVTDKKGRIVYVTSKVSIADSKSNYGPGGPLTN